MVDDGTNPFGGPMQSPELRRLEPLLGKWQTAAKTEASILECSPTRETDT